MVKLESPRQGLRVPPGNWLTVFGASSDAAVLVLASHVYAESDYLRDYDAFLAFKGLR